MQINQSYPAPSSATPQNGGLGFSLQTEAARPGVHLEALVKHSRAYSRVMAALHRVVSQEARPVQRDHSDYQAWVQGQYLLELPALALVQNDLLARRDVLREKIGGLETREQELQTELTRLTASDSKTLWDAKRKFWNYLYSHNRALWFVLDPVVSVHADATLFEVFSRDESSYACVRVPSENLDVLGPVSWGTTNVDFSQKLADELERVRDYRPAFLSVGQGGVSVQTTAGARFEKKIDLPPSWVRGFLQVQSASALAQTSLVLSATTVGEILRILALQNPSTGPRALKFHLENGQKPRIEIEPNGDTVVESRHVYEGQTKTVRLWGRKRLRVLGELLPHAQNVEVRLLGEGLPSFWAIELEGHRFELGLSGWTANDWGARARFDTLASSENVTTAELKRGATILSEHWRLSVEEFCAKSGFGRAKATAILQALCARGDAMFDAKIEAYRWRKLLPFDAPESPQDEGSKKAAKWIQTGGASLQKMSVSRVENDEFLKRYQAHDLTFFEANVQTSGGVFTPIFARDLDGRVRFWMCSCGEFRRDKGRNGPCAHLLAGLQLAIKEEGAA